MKLEWNGYRDILRITKFSKRASRNIRKYTHWWWQIPLSCYAVENIVVKKFDNLFSNVDTKL